MARPRKTDRVRTPAEEEKYRLKLLQQRDYRKRVAEAGTKKHRPSSTDVILAALEGRELDKPSILLERNSKEWSEGVEKFFPGTPGHKLQLFEICAEVLQTYEDGGGNAKADLEQVSKFLSQGPLPAGAYKFLPRVKPIAKDERLALTAGALLLLLSWVQRKREQMLSILMDFRSEADGEGSKTKALREALEELLIGPANYMDNSKKSQSENSV